MSLSQYPYRLLARWIADDPQAWVALGDFETRLLSRRLPNVVQPVYISGLARAGTTILTEAVARHPDVATHRYRDFPCILTPYFWHRILSSFDWVPKRAKPQERAHQDGIMVTPQSPEAMEEIIWMAFFKKLHEENRSAVLGADTQNPAFEVFYRAHIGKVLLARKRGRYASKANYNLTRTAYLKRLFPDARFVLVVRHPLAHVASLKAKDALFSERQKRDPKALTHMNQSGHFEFGLNRRLIHTGDNAAMESVQAAFAGGDDWRGWARYWAMIHRYIHTLSAEPGVLVVRHEDLCARPQEKLREIFAHAGLTCDERTLASAASLIREEKPVTLDAQTQDIILQETRSATEWF